MIGSTTAQIDTMIHMSGPNLARYVAVLKAAAARRGPPFTPPTAEQCVRVQTKTMLLTEEQEIRRMRKVAMQTPDSGGVLLYVHMCVCVCF